MRELNPVQVITVLIERLEKRADALEGVKLAAYDMAVIELRGFADMAKRARKYLTQRVDMP